ncbi:hypothetical protein HIM_01197 [Hirsutella minnesotensis 3608]|nr:hypothetical protein HIM_01197 [Hirsutella minnesotensis 3608]
MQFIAIFAGLGSDALFSDKTLQRASQDALRPECQMLLKTCHRSFCRHITKAVNQGQLPVDRIDLDDFQDPESLLQPPSQYRQSVVIQHTTIFLIQLLRYLGSGGDSSRLRGVAGFCVGLLSAVTVATARDDLELLQNAQDFFGIALWLGIYCDKFRNSQIQQSGCPPDLPWSVVVNNVAGIDIPKLDMPTSVHVSARNSATCITLSGRGDELEKFVRDRLPAQCTTRPINVLTLYHNRGKLQSVSEETMIAVQDIFGPRLDLSINLVAPLFNSVSGARLDLNKGTLRQLVELILEMILHEPVDWEAVEEAILEDFRRSSSQTPVGCEILNYGPGYGMSRPARRLPEGLSIRDVSAQGVKHTLWDNATAIGEDDIAIVGMAIDLPGAEDIHELWEMLCNGVNTCSEIPLSRFHIEDFYQRRNAEGIKSKRSIETRHGNFLKDPFLFDNDLFGISPREARSMDPQQRVLLQTSYRALEDAGYVPDSTLSYARETFGCFLGNATLDYTDNLRSDIDVYYSPGANPTSIPSGRISYYYGWSGPSMTIDTACSSSMVAVHQGVRAILAGDCRAALVGGVNVMTSPDMYLGLDRAHFLSPTGQCKSFDASADGYCRSDGCGIFVLKRMTDALAEGDRIHGVIKGIEVNQSGNAHSITHPHAQTQQQLFHRLFDKTGIDPHQVSVVETHGTGTQAGDPKELESLRAVLCDGRIETNPVHFTSIKANIGHCEAASGAAALTKVLLMMKHGHIPPQISLKNLNPKIAPLGIDGAIISTTGVPWRPATHQPRTSLVNNFGAAGSNAAMIVQEFCQSSQARVTPSDRTYMLGISGKTAKVASRLRDNLIQSLSDGPLAKIPLADMCYTLTARRQLYDQRLSVVANSIPQLIQNLQRAEPVLVKNPHGSVPQVAFVFSGQGSQYLGMGQELMSMYPVFSKTIYLIDSILRQTGLSGCLSMIDPTTSQEEADPRERLLTSQCAIFALQVALAQLLISWNVLPSVVIGHSLGEYAALVTAGVLSVADGSRLIARRAELMARECKLGETSMLAVHLGASEARNMLDCNSRFSQLAISCANSPTDCVVGGPLSDLEVFQTHLKNSVNVKSKLLDVPLAYHTVAVDPIISELKGFVETLNLGPPKLAVVSNVLGRTVNPGERVFTPDYFIRHSREVVAFERGLRDYTSSHSNGVKTHWIELGPHASILPMVAAQTQQSQTSLHPCLKRGVSPASTLSQLKSSLYQSTIQVDWRKAFAFENQPSLVTAPGLPFFQTEYLVSYPRESFEAPTKCPRELLEAPTSPFIGRTIQRANKSNGLIAVYETSTESLKELITGHVVCDYALCPASVYHQMVLAAIEDIQSSNVSDSVWSLVNVDYVSPLIYQSASPTLVRIRVSLAGDLQSETSFDISSYGKSADSSNGRVHCKGKLKHKPREHTERKYARAAQLLRRQVKNLSHPEPNSIIETLSTRSLYENVFSRVVIYSELYQRVQIIRISPDYGEAHAQCKHLDECPGDEQKVKAVFMDVLLHVAGFVANMAIPHDEVGFCKELSSALVLRKSIVPSSLFQVFCTLVNDSAQGCIIADAQAYDENGIIASFKGMAFQRFKITKIRQAFDMTFKRESRSSPEVTRQSRSSIPEVHDVSVGERRKADEDLDSITEIHNIIAQTCGADTALLSASSNLEELGFDSLLMIELEAQLSSLYPSMRGSSLTICHTVGDIDRALTSSYTAKNAMNTPTSSAPESLMGDDYDEILVDIRRQSRLIIADVCCTDIDTIGSVSQLTDIGVDSIMFYELERNLASLCRGKKLSSAELSECRTVGDVERLIVDHQPQREAWDSMESTHVSIQECMSTTSSALSVQSTDSESPTGTNRPKNLEAEQEREASVNSSLVDKISRFLNLNEQPQIVQIPHQTEAKETETPLFLIHDGSGVCTHYHRLSSLNRVVYALHDPKLLDPSDNWSSLSEMASQYATVIESTKTEPYLLGGWSFGGVVAFEAARLLALRGHQVIGTVLIDSPPPINHQALSDDIIDAVVNQGKTHRTELGEALQHLIRRSFANCARLLENFAPPAPDASQPPRVYLLWSKDGWVHPEEPQRQENKWLQDRSDAHECVAEWEMVTGSHVPWSAIPGNHFQAFDSENIGAVSQAVLDATSELQSSFQTCSRQGRSTSVGEKS